MITESIDTIHKWLRIGGFKDGDDSKINLSLNLIDEELEELKESIYNNDEQGVYDSVADLWFVIHNTTFFLNLHPEDINHYFENVIKSNYSKYCITEKEAEDTVEAYRSGTHPNKTGHRIDSYYEKVGEYYVVKRHDGKILKSINWKEPNIWKK